MTGDDDIVPLSTSLAWQSQVCERAGAPVSAAVLRAVDNLSSKGAVAAAATLPSHVRFGDFAPLRILAALHAAALERSAPLLAMLLPTAGGSGSLAAAGLEPAVMQALENAPVGEYLLRAPQTNEVGRARAMRVALAALRSIRPVHLHELGCSAGLLLNVDRLEAMPGEEALPLPPIASRVGYDINPVDASTPSGRLLLSSYVWPDHVERFRRLGAAFTAATEYPPHVRAMDALSAVRQLRPEPGSTTLIWHSALLPYLAGDVRAQMAEALDQLGRSAPADSVLAIASWEEEPDASERRPDFQLRLQMWREGRSSVTVLAHGNSHATDVTVLGQH